MAKDKNEVRYDADGARRVMRTGDYMAGTDGKYCRTAHLFLHG